MVSRKGISTLAQRQEHYPWQDLERRYVEGETKDGVLHFPTVRELCESLTIPGNLAYMTVHAVRHKWTEKRALFQAKTETARKEKRSEALVKEAVNLDMLALDAVRQGYAIVGEHYKRAEDNLKGEKETLLDIGKLNGLVVATQRLSQVHKSIMGEGGEGYGNTWVDLVKKALTAIPAEESVTEKGVVNG